jgi:hypothetical protein
VLAYCRVDVDRSPSPQSSEARTPTAGGTGSAGAWEDEDAASGGVRARSSLAFYLNVRACVRACMRACHTTSQNSMHSARAALVCLGRAAEMKEETEVRAAG